MSSLDFIQIQEDCTALLKNKSHSFKALPALFLLDNDVKYESNFGPNVIMVRTLPPMKMSLPESVVTPANPLTTDAVVSAPKSPTSSEEQQEKFRLSIANWCLANEGLRKSIQSLQQPPPMSLCLSSESLASICSGLQALDSGVADISEDLDDNVVEDIIEKKDVDENPVEMMDDQETDSAASSSSTHEEDEIEVPEVSEVNEDDEEEQCQKDIGEIDNDKNEDDNNDDKQEVEVQVLEVDEEIIKQILEEEGDDGLMNVNVKERRQCLIQMINTQVIKKVGQKATLSRMAAKNAAVVKMAVKNLNNFNKISENTENENSNDSTEHDRNNLETASIIAIEASSKVKLMVSKFDNQ